MSEVGVPGATRSNLAGVGFRKGIVFVPVLWMWKVRHRERQKYQMEKTISHFLHHLFVRRWVLLSRLGVDLHATQDHQGAQGQCLA